MLRKRGIKTGRQRVNFAPRKRFRGARYAIIPCVLLIGCSAFGVAAGRGPYTATVIDPATVEGRKQIRISGRGIDGMFTYGVSASRMTTVCLVGSLNCYYIDEALDLESPGVPQAISRLRGAS